MSKPVKLVVSIYLAAVAIICCGYLLMILVGSFQGNDMKGSVLDADSSKNIENVDNIDNTSNATPTESTTVPKGSQSSIPTHSNTLSILQNNKTHTWSLDNSTSKAHV
ncbi:hypothetical protein [Staphylococcus caeli]|uniref:Uncharacterized protein n=1 Tax=Staphylococcus caeli TaxID=2201815 RepID=A0A1D4HN83_9STAP|nr:hypothetical protein [Staphylococcus caeli]SCS38652.1 Uncharacterised protein [Staphylococcus caeli]SCS56907.1 Uncharacterised protein [Staphylococcus caeli]